MNPTISSAVLLRPVLFRLLGCLLLLAGLTQCAGPGGTEYASARSKGGLNPPPGKGMVLIYWEPGLAGRGLRFKVWANDQIVASQMRRGAFIAYPASPGALRLGTGEEGLKSLLPQGGLPGGVLGYLLNRKKERLVLHVEAGHTYYVRANGDLTLSTQEEGEEGIAECRLLQP